MAYKALYRSYRPTTFKEVVGQKHVIQTLKNAISEKRTSHAYVFSGLRGIGKTTIARILAKAVNCLNPIDGEPCNECEHCKAIINNETTDILELDAASNNGVDEIRGLLEKVNFLPSFLNKKVYIIDEVHMLSTAAFNALLKTLEEPPAYVMFILATTEPHKIPMTILSRCQRFDFKQLTVEELTKELIYICEKEQIKAAPEALNVIATAAEGGMRDALSILDQASIYADGEITAEDVNSITGNISNQKLIELVNAFNNDDASKAIDVVNELLNMGKEVSRLTTCIIQFCRDILLYKNMNHATTDKYIYSTTEFIQLAETTDNQRLFYYIDVLVDVQNKIRFTNSQKIYLEVGIMKIINSTTGDIDLLGRIKTLETRLDSDGVPEYSGTYISNNNNYEQRLSVLENKIKRLNNELEKANLNLFEEKINSKVNILEEAISSVSALPNTIEDRINILEGRITDILEGETELQMTSSSTESNHNSDVNYNERLIKLEQEFHETTTKCNAFLTSLSEDIEVLKENSSSEDNINDDVILELIEKVTEIENKLTTSTGVSSGFELNTDVKNELNKLTVEIENLKQKMATLNVNQDEIGLSNDHDSELVEVVNELIADFNNLKQLVDTIKNNNQCQDFSLYNKDKEIENKVDELIHNVQELAYKLSLLENNNDNNQLSNNQDLTNLINKVNELEQLVKNVNIGNLELVINEVKTNYFVLTQALTYMKEKIDVLNVSESNVDFTEIEKQISSLANEINELKENKLNQEMYDELVNQINELKKHVEKLNVPVAKEPVVNQVEPKVEVKPDPVEEEPVKIIKEEKDLTSQIYDIKIVENILHEARLPECRELKAQLVAKWSKLSTSVGGTLIPIAKMLANGLLVANGNTHLLIVYPNAQLCNYIMDPKNYKDALEIIKTTFGKAFEFIALPDDTWKEKRLEYHNQYRIGSSYPKLTPINNPKLRIVVVSSKPLTEREKVLKKADDFFGTDDEEGGE